MDKQHYFPLCVAQDLKNGIFDKLRAYLLDVEDATEVLAELKKRDLVNGFNLDTQTPEAIIEQLNKETILAFDNFTEKLSQEINLKNLELGKGSRKHRNDITYQDIIDYIHLQNDKESFYIKNKIPIIFIEEKERFLFLGGFVRDEQLTKERQEQEKKEERHRALVAGKTLIMLGYWYSEEEYWYPMPHVFLGQKWNAIEREAVIKHLKEAEDVRLFRGFARCRVCRKPVGTTDKCDGLFLFPGGLEHYIEEHDLKLPDVFIDYVMKRLDTYGFEQTLKKVHKEYGNEAAKYMETIDEGDYQYHLDHSWWMAFKDLENPPATSIFTKLINYFRKK